MIKLFGQQVTQAVPVQKVTTCLFGVMAVIEFCLSTMRSYGNCRMIFELLKPLTMGPTPKFSVNLI